MLKLGTKIISTNLGFFNPYSLNFAITYLCNGRCRFCQIWKNKQGRLQKELTLAEIKKFTKKATFLRRVTITGGEPFLRKDYVEILRAFHEKIPDLYLLTSPTNAVLPEATYKKIVDVLKFFKKRYIITISLDGARAVHDKLRGVPGNWDRATDLYVRLKELKNRYKNFDVFFGYTIYPENVGLFEHAFDAVKKKIPRIKPRDFYINIFQMSDIYYGNKNIGVPRGFPKKAIKELEKIRRARGRTFYPLEIIEGRYLRFAATYLKTWKPPIKCKILDLSAFVDPFGNVYPCIIYNKKLGTLRGKKIDYDLMKILTSEEAKKINKEIRRGVCPHCWTSCEAHNLILSNWLKL